MSHPDKSDAQQLLTTGPQAGEVYRHYKGDLYEVLVRSVKEDALEQLVTYRSLKKGFVWTRTLADWSMEIYGHPRFVRVDPVTLLPLRGLNA